MSVRADSAFPGQMAPIGRADYYYYAMVTNEPLFQNRAFIDYCRLCFKANHAGNGSLNLKSCMVDTEGRRL